MMCDGQREGLSLVQSLGMEMEASRFRDGAIKATAVCVLIGDSWSQVLTN